MPAFGGFDHVDCRVRSLPAVESFYDALMPELGLSTKRYSNVDEKGDWHDADADRYNTVEYYEDPAAGRATFFMGIIEDPAHGPSATRIAFRVKRERLDSLEALLRSCGARTVERSGNMEEYPAIFFADPAGTRLELVAR